MAYQYVDERIGSLLAHTNFLGRDLPHFRVKEKLLHILWNQSEHPQRVQVDGVTIELRENQMLTTTYLQKVQFPTDTPLTGWSFNREFYCIQDHDNEVSCNGIIFLGAQAVSVIDLQSEDLRKLTLLKAVFEDEFSTRDNIQGEMLRILLKRLIILVTRMARHQQISENIEDESLDIIRQFNVLVDLHFKEKKLVADYADMLHKSPKTLSNLFALHHQKTPLQIIHQRIALEAKRRLLYSEASMKEIAFGLGYKDVAAFSKLVKKHLGMTPGAYRKQVVG